MAKKEIKITCDVRDHLSYKKITPFQGELKTITPENLDRLKKLIKSKGYNSPVEIWKHDGKNYNLDGHQGVKAVEALEKEGFKIPKLPVIYIKCKNKKEAKEILLSRIAAFGKMDKAGLYEFMGEAGLNIKTVKDSFVFNDFDVEKFGHEYFDPPKENSKPGADEISPDTHSNLIHTCPKCQFKFGKGAK